MTGLVNGGTKSATRPNWPFRSRSKRLPSTHARSVHIGLRPSLSSKAWLTPAALILLPVVLVAALGLTSSPPAQAQVPANPSWGSSSGGWSGSGSVYLPGGSHVGGSESSGSSQCQGCTWKVIPICLDDVLDPCEPVPPFAWCGTGEVRYRIMFGQGGAAPTSQGTQCIGSGSRPVSSVEVDDQVQDRVKQLAPALSFDYQPTARVVTQLPAIFRLSQPNEVSRSDSIAGLSVRMRAQVSRVWQWGDGASRRTTETGGRWPDTSLSHTYRTAGTKQVRVSANWTAEYSVAGGRWLQVAGDPVQQSASRSFRVREARAQLVE